MAGLVIKTVENMKQRLNGLKVSILKSWGSVRENKDEHKPYPLPSFNTGVFITTIPFCFAIDNNQSTIPQTIIPPFSPWIFLNLGIDFQDPQIRISLEKLHA